MASKLIVPFNYQPFSVSVKTGAYTIPAGYYAFVSAFCDAGETFSIGGVVALRGNSAIAASGTGGVITEVNSTATNTTAVYSYAVPAGYKFFWQAVMISNYTGTPEVFVDAQSTSGHRITSSVPTLWTGTYGWHFGSLFNTYPILAPGQTASVDVNSTASILKRIQGWIERPNSINAGQTGTTSTNTYWVPSGTALTTSGGEYTVTLYPNIS